MTRRKLRARPLRRGGAPGVRRSLARWGAALALVLCGCSAELLHGLDEEQANQAVAALGERGIDSDKTGDERPASYKVLVPRADQARALRVLEERGLPRRGGKGVGETFAESGLLPSPGVERARLVAALAVEAERALEAIPGVAAARVLLSLPVPEPLRLDAARPRTSASVVLRVRGVPALGEGELRKLVASGIDGLHPDDVQVTVVRELESPAPPHPTAMIRLGPLWLTPRAANVMAALLAIAVVVLVASLLLLRVQTARPG